MDKRYLVIIILFLITIGCVVLYSNNYSKNTMQIGDLTFDIPQNYEMTGLNGDGGLILRNNEIDIYITCYKSNENIDKIVNDYANEREQNNISITLFNRTINNLHVFKSDSSQGANHYWFEYNGRIYSIYTWKETPNIDKIVTDLISSALPN